MEFENENFSLKLDMKYIAIIILIIAMTVLIFSGKLKEPSIAMILGSIIELVSK